MSQALLIDKASERELELEQEDLVERARNGLLNFTTYTFPDYQVNWHHRVLCRYLNQFVEGKIKRLMVFLPPRTGKSQLVSRQLPAYILGRNPNTKIISTSYSADLASRMNRDVQRIIDSSSYAELFPDTKLFGKGMRTVLESSWLRNSDIFEVVNHQGVYRSAGVGGGITGMGGNCFPAGTLVETEEGPVDIAFFAMAMKWPKVLSFNHETKRNEYRTVLAGRVLSDANFVRIKTIFGRELTATRDHNIYDVERKCYRPIGLFSPGDWIKTPENIYPISDVTHSCLSSRPVYDIQVEGNHNFFANGILVHNCIIIDDPIKNQQEADSPVYRDKLWEWYLSTLYTRLEKNGGICVTLTRWNEDDLAGRLLQQARENPQADQWVVVNLPMLCEAKTEDDPRELDEPLWPDKYDYNTLLTMRATLGSRTWNSMHQQRPAPEKGMIVNREWWRFYTELPAQMEVAIQAWDLAFVKSDSSDFVAGVVLGKVGADIYLIDLIHDRLSFNESLAAVRNLSRKWPEGTAKYVEKAANGAALIDTLRSEIPGLIAVPPLGSKVARAHAVAPRIEAGNVWLPDPSVAPWVHKVIEEWTAFPAGAHDDIVDAMSHGIAKLMEMKATDWLPVSLSGQNIWNI